MLLFVFKVANPAELLQLLINFDLLQEAGAVALEYLSAVMGHGKEYFGLEVGCHVCSSEAVMNCVQGVSQVAVRPSYGRPLVNVDGYFLKDRPWTAEEIFSLNNNLKTF